MQDKKHEGQQKQPGQIEEERRRQQHEQQEQQRRRRQQQGGQDMPGQGGRQNRDQEQQS